MISPSDNENSWHSDHPPTSAAASKGLDLDQVRLALRANASSICLAGISLFAVVMAFTMASRMEFLVRGRLYLGELEGRQSNPVSELSNFGGSDVYSEVEIMRSRSRIEQAVLASGLNATLIPRVPRAPATLEQLSWLPNEPRVPRTWDWLTSRRDPSILDFSFTTLQVSKAALSPRTPDARKFVVQFKDDSHYRIYDRKYRFLSNGVLGRRLDLPQLTLLLIGGTESQPAPGATYDLEIEPTEKTVEEVLKNLEIKVPKVPAASEPVKVLVLELVTKAPHQAAVFLSMLMQTHLDERHIWKTEDATAAEDVIVRQLAGMEKALDLTEHQLAAVRTKNPSVVQQSQPQSMVAQLSTYEQQRTAARLQASMMENVLKKLQQPTSSLETFMFGETNDAVLHQLGASLAQSRHKLVELSSKFSDSAPEVKQQQAEIYDQLHMIRNYVSGRLSRALEQVRELDEVIARSNKELTAVPDAELKLAQIERKSDVYSRVYSYLLESQQRTAILKATTGSKNRILDWPSIPSREQGPNLLMRALSLPFGLLVAALFVVMRSFYSSALRSEAEVRRLLPGVAVFASVPRLANKLMTNRKRRFYDVGSLPPKALGLAEAVRTLRTNLYHSMPGPQGKVILFTSPAPLDGKTTLCLCLAGTLAADNKRVLVIDADLRKQSHFQLLGRKLGEGLSELSSEDPPANHGQPVPLRHGQFDSLDAGFDVPTELLSSTRFGALLLRLRTEYDYVLLDAPSYPPAADVLVLAAQSDFVLSVVRLGSTARSTAEEHMRGLVSRSRGYAVIVNDSESALERRKARSGRSRGARAVTKLRGANGTDARAHEPPN